MARAPRAKVSATTGQGVSRLAYQRGYALRQGDAPKVKGDAKPDKRDYAKGKAPKKAKASGPGFNVSYGDTLAIGDLQDVENFLRK